MSARTLEAKHKCDSCGEVHDTQYEAVECCPNYTSEVFVCPVCYDYFKTAEDALQCWEECESEDEESSSESRGPTGRELEAQGQMRLDQL